MLSYYNEKPTTKFTFKQSIMLKQGMLIFILFFFHCEFYSQEKISTKREKRQEVRKHKREVKKNDRNQRIVKREERAKNVPINVYFDTDLGFASSANDTRKEASAGTGKLGLDFERGFVNGSIKFTVFSQNKSISTTDSTDQKLFGSNLLIPQNSSNNISNFSFFLSTRSFFRYDKVPDDLPIFSFKRFGSNLLFQINNTIWTKDSLSTPITINSFNLNLTYNLLNLEVLKSKEKIRIYFSVGYTSRRLGGDYGLSSYKDYRKSFLNTTDLGFDGIDFGARLELGKFYGQMNLTSFDRNKDIKGFSGNQAIITLGIKADLKIAAKNVKDKEIGLDE